MNRSQLFIVLAVVGALLWVRSPLLAVDGKEPVRNDFYLAGFELGATGATSPLDRYVNNGAVLAPFGAYMFNKYIGFMGQMHVVAMPSADACQPKDHPKYSYDGCYKNKPLEDNWVWTLGATVGPRLALPLGGVEVWGTAQGGGFAGLSGDSAISDTSWGVSTGGGVNLTVTDTILVGAFGRYNYLYQQAHSRGRVAYTAGGVAFTYKFAPTEQLPDPK